MGIKKADNIILPAPYLLLTDEQSKIDQKKVLHQYILLTITFLAMYSLFSTLVRIK